MSIIDIKEFHFVAFIDLLGFSDMVKHDLEAPNGQEKYVQKLFEIHSSTLALQETGFHVNLIQFSDSIVLSTEYNPRNFDAFLNIIGQYQYNLFCKGILSRGGIAYGKHFFENGFLYSMGLIEAYRIESKIAKYPRIVISTDLFDLIYSDQSYTRIAPIMKENDDLFFIDYLEHGRIEENCKYLNEILKTAVSPEVKEKHLWLLDYFIEKYPESDLKRNRFQSLV